MRILKLIITCLGVVGWLGYATATKAASYMEVGSVTVSTTVDQGGWVTVNLQGIYTNPVIVAGPATHNNDNTLGIRVRNKTPTSFEIGVQSPCESAGSVASGATCPGSWSPETLNYIAIELGTWTLEDGSVVTAGLSTISAVRHNPTALDASQLIGYSLFNDNPVVLHTVNSYNDSGFIASSVWRPWFGLICNNANADRSATPGLLAACLALEGMEVTASHSPETVGWLAIERGSATADGYEFIVGEGTVTRHGGCNKVGGFSFTTAPLVIASHQTAAGDDGALLRLCNSGIETNGISSHADEDQVVDAERTGDGETIGYLAFPEAALIKLASADLIAYYSFDGITGQTVFDTSGNGLNGTLGGSSSPGSDDPTNNCNGFLDFYEDYVQVADNALLDLPAEFTISFWFRTSWNPSGASGSQFQLLLGKDNNFGFWLEDEGFAYSTWEFYWDWQNSSGTGRVFDTEDENANIYPNTWYHATFTYSQSEARQAIYLNGNLLATASYNDTLATNSQPLRMGVFTSINYPLYGSIDEVRIYNGVLDALEIAEISQPYDNCAPTRKLAYFNFDYTVLHGIANEVADGTGNNAGLTPLNGATTAEVDRAISSTPGTCEYLVLDGVNDYLQTNDSATELQVYNDYSVTFWINSASSQKSFAAIYSKTDSSNSTNHWTLQQDGSSGGLAVVHGGSFWDTSLDISDISGGWHHVAIVREGTTQRVYLDGSWRYSGTFPTAPGNGNGHLNIGTDRTGSSSYAWDGLIDEFNVYDYALTDPAVAGLAAETHACKVAFSSCEFTLRDQFDTVSYSQNDGTEYFSSQWLENDDNLPNSGTLQILGGEATYQASSGSVVFDRFVNLSESDNPKLSFRLRSLNTEGSGFLADSVEVYAYDGTTFFLIERIDTLEGTQDITRTYNLGGYSIEDGAIRFAFNTSASDEVFYLDNVDIRPFCAPTRYVDITVDSTASTCTPEIVTLRICQDANCNNVFSQFNGTVNLTTSSSHGTWTAPFGNGTLSDPTPNDGQASYTFSTDDAGLVYLYLSNPHADVLRITGTSTDLYSDISDTVTFSDNALRVTPTLIGGQSSVIAGKSVPLTIEYVARDGAECGVIPCSGTFNIATWASHNTFLGPPSPSSPALNGNSIPPLFSSAIDVPLTFTNGTASATLLHNDVGVYTLNFQDTTSGCAVDANNDPITISGNSSSIIMRPFGLRFANEPTNPQLAQDSLTINVEGVLWEAGDDVNTDGYPDTGADLSNNTLIPNYGNEGFPQPPTLSLVETWPTTAGSTQGTLSSGMSSRGNGLYTMSLSYSEVGEIQVQATVNGYLGSSENLSLSTDSQWLRFHPSYLQLNPVASPSLQPSCSGGNFSYLGQTLGYNVQPAFELRAYGVNNVEVNNYKETYFNWAPTQGPALAANSSMTDANFSGTPGLVYGATAWSILSNSSNQYGIPTTFSLNHSFDYPKGISPIDQFTPAPSITWLSSYFVDSDSVCLKDSHADADCNSLNFTVGAGGSSMRYGRLHPQGTSGPSEEDLEVIVHAEYWDAATSTFIVNAQDSCTPINSNYFDLNGGVYTGNLDNGETAFISDSDLLVSGERILTLISPGSANSGSVLFDMELDANGLGYLMYDWEGTGSDINPDARATFGIYRGNDRIISWEEIQWFFYFFKDIRCF